MLFSKSTRCSVVFGVLMAFLPICPSLALGQNPLTPSRDAELRVIVFDPSGAVIPKATIRFEGKKSFSISTAENGSIQVRLPSGNYELTVSSPGYETTKITHRVDADNRFPLTLVMQFHAPKGDCLPCSGPGVETIASDLPNVIETVRVPDAATALRMAEPSLIRKFGNRVVNEQKPLTATLQDGVWTISGSDCCSAGKRKRTCEPGRCFGGGVALRLRQSDGSILSISVAK